MKPFEITRVFDAPRERVWKSWTEAERLKRWWGPKGFVVTHREIDLRPGGMMHYCLRAPEGSDMQDFRGRPQQHAHGLDRDL